MIWGYRNILTPKNQTRKNDKIDKDFELYQVFMHNVSIIYIADQKNQHILFEGF